MRSVKTRLFINISILIIFFVLLSWALSALALERFYIWHKKNNVIDSGRMINELYAADPGNISGELERIANNLGAGIVIFGADNEVKASSFERYIKQKAQPPKPEGGNNNPPPFVVKATETVDSNSVVEIEQDQSFNLSFMVLKRHLNEADLLVIRLPLAAVAESASYAGNFMLFTGLLTILAGCSWAFFFAKRFTLPLLELGRVAQSISQLDFSQKCTVAGRDEVGELGNSINNLSAQLDKSITELNLRNQQLQADVEEERRLDKMRKNFISSVSHELKTPIALILGYAEGLQENVATDETGKNYYCSVIADEAAKMDKLVQDLLNLSQFESGFFRLEKTEFDLAALIDEVLQKYRAILQDKNICLKLQVPSSVEVCGDKLRIEQIVVNYLNNAIDHVDDKNIICVSTREKDEKIRLCVYNSGKNIPAESLENIWLSFYKVDKARSRSLGGHGLGLSIVRAIQELHGKLYGVENSATGVGFWIDLAKGGKFDKE